MNLFYLDEDPDLCAEYHVDSHVVKLPTEAAQMLTTAIWVDHLLGFVPRALTSEELQVLKEFKATQPSIEERTFTRFLPSHVNHPANIWVRSSLDNYDWTYIYTDALNSEYCYRYDKVQNHKSFEAARALPAPNNMPSLGITCRPQCMPEEYRSNDPIQSYREYYMFDKANIAVWKRRQKPPWWDEYLVEYAGKDPHQSYINTTRAPTNKNKPYSQDAKLYIGVK